MSQEVTFIRKHGRVIPIRKRPKKSVKSAVKAQKPVKLHNKPAVQAGVFSAAGLSIAALGGFFSGKTVKKAEGIHQQSFDFFEEKKKGTKLPKGVESVGEGFQKARRKAKFGFKSKTLFGIAATSALSLGITKGIEALGADRPTLKQEAGREFAAVTASTVLLTGFAKGAGFKRPKIKIPISVKRTAKDLASAFVRRQLRFKL